MPFSIKIYQNLVFWHAISFQAGRYPNLEKQKHNWEQKGKRNELISKSSKTCEVEFAALKNRLTDIKSELQEAFVVLLRLYDGMWQHDVYLRKPSGMNSTWKVDSVIILPNWLPVSAAATRKHVSNVTQTRRIMESPARNFWGPTRS